MKRLKGTPDLSLWELDALDLARDALLSAARKCASEALDIAFNSEHTRAVFSKECAKELRLGGPLTLRLEVDLGRDEDQPVVVVVDVEEDLREQDLDPANADLLADKLVALAAKIRRSA